MVIITQKTVLWHHSERPGNSKWRIYYLEVFMELKKLTAIANFLETVYEGIGTKKIDDDFENDYLPLEYLNQRMKKDQNGNSNTKQMQSGYLGEDGFLCRITALADSDLPEAKNAAYQLGRFYLGLDRPKGLEMPYNEDIALGFLAKAARLGHKKAKEEYCLLAEYKGYYNSAYATVPEDPYLKELRQEYYLCCSEISAAMGGRNPAIDKDGYVPEAKTGDTFLAVKSAFLKIAEKAKFSRMSFHEKVYSLENKINANVLQLEEELDRAYRTVIREKRARRWIRRLIILALILLALPAVNGGPENTHPILYFLFLLPNTLAILNGDVSSFAEYMMSYPTQDERVMQLTVSATLLLILNLCITIFSKFYSPKTVKSYHKKKRALMKKYGIAQVVNEANRIINSDTALTQEEKAVFAKYHIRETSNVLDEFAIFYHHYKFLEHADAKYKESAYSKQQWEYAFTVPAWFTKKHPDSEEKLAACAQQYMQSYGGGKYFSYESVCALFCTIAGHLKAARYYKSLHYSPWNAAQLWQTFVKFNNDQNHSRTQLIHTLSYDLLIKLYQQRADDGDREAMYRLAKALFPDNLGYKYAKKAHMAKHPEAAQLEDAYFQYHNPPEPIEDFSVNRSTSSESDPDPWGFKAWGAESDRKAREHNDNVLFNAHMRGDIDREEYERLKEKHGTNY